MKICFIADARSRTAQNWINGVVAKGHFVRTASHNTLQIDGRDQIVHHRRFKFLFWTKAKLLRCERGMAGCWQRESVTATSAIVARLTALMDRRQLVEEMSVGAFSRAERFGPARVAAAIEEIFRPVHPLLS